MSKSTTEIRQMFLDFFQSKNHKVIPSSSLVLNKDKTLLFTNAGMNQFKNVFLGTEIRNYSRATTSQRCVRAGGKHNDLEKVGYTTCHHTFFEMLGNFSFGDYFKYDAIKYAWELLTGKNWFNLNKERLWVTVYENDEETYNIWLKDIVFPRERIIRIGDNKGILYSSDNFWQMGDTGPCGPCTEIFYDHGDHIRGNPPGSIKKYGDRYIEIWNIVFMQFNRQSDGTMKLLPRPSVDTGMGLERVAAILQQVKSNYEIDLFHILIKAVSKITGITDLNNKSLHVIADHIRSCAFLIADSVIPSNESRGYVLRRIIRRAIRHGNMLGIKDAFLYKLVDPLVKVMGTIGESLKLQQSRIEQVLKIEEEQFARTLKHGLLLLNNELAKLKGDTLEGSIAFRLYDTYGFPIDLTEDICRDLNIKVDKINFEYMLEKQRNLGRNTKHFNVSYKNIFFINQSSKFQGYEKLELNSKVLALFINGELVKSISSGQTAIVVLDETPFYAESGGQVGDTGELNGQDFKFIVNDTQKYGQAIGHIGILKYGCLKIETNLLAVVNKIRRVRIHLNHTATHLIHAALRKILGNHVAQKGSMINDKMLRFDFSHFKMMSLTEIHNVENLVNEQIRCNFQIKTKIMDFEEAKNKGALAIFGDKYDSQVRVLRIGDFSSELCGGTHALRTGDIGLLCIVSECSIASGIRRIEAVTGESAINRIHKQSNQIQNIALLLKRSACKIEDEVCNLLKQNRVLEKELQHLNRYIILKECDNLSSKIIKIKDINILAKNLLGVNLKTLHVIVNKLKNQLSSTVVILTTIVNNKIHVILGVSNNIIDRIKIQNLINIIANHINGKGGGRSDIAQICGKNIKTLTTVLDIIKNWISNEI